jgi:hypothetical protein
VPGFADHPRASPDASGVALEVLGDVGTGSADALLVIVARNSVSVEEVTNASTRLDCMAPP